MPPIPDHELLQTAVLAAQCGGKHALQHYARRRHVIRTFAHDLKLELDVECQKQVESLIRQRHEEHTYLGEEDAALHGSGVSAKEAPCGAAYEWIIDPIDGTVNFSHGLPMWCCSVAVRDAQGTVRAAAVYAPMLEDLYTATAEGPACKNESPIQVSACKTLAGGIVMTGMDKNIEPGLAPLAYFQAISHASQKARIAGSAAVDLCWVAEGAADGYFEGSIFLWDIAAAGLIARRAGGTTEILKQRTLPHQLSFLASNGHIHAELRQLVTAVAP